MSYVPEAEVILETLKQKKKNIYIWYVSAFYEMRSKKVIKTFLTCHKDRSSFIWAWRSDRIKIYRNVKQEGRSSETQRILRMAEDNFFCQPRCFIYMETKHRRNILRMKEKSDCPWVAPGAHMGHVANNLVFMYTFQSNYPSNSP